jgi:hypothetical protein
MKAWYFPEGDGNRSEELLYVPKEIIVIRVERNYGVDWTPESLETMKKFIIEKRRKLERRNLMREIEVSDDLVKDLKFQVTQREMYPANLMIMPLLQAARLYGRAG